MFPLNALSMVIGMDLWTIYLLHIDPLNKYSHTLCCTTCSSSETLGTDLIAFLNKVPFKNILKHTTACIHELRIIVVDTFRKGHERNTKSIHGAITLVESCCWPSRQWQIAIPWSSCLETIITVDPIAQWQMVPQESKQSVVCVITS